MTLTEDTLKKIKEEKIAPKPKWHFLLKESFIWVAFGVAILVGSMAVSVILFTYFNGDFDLVPQTNSNFFQYFLQSLPYVWAIVLGGFLVISYLAYEHTKDGYKHKPIVIWAASIVISVIVGALLFAAGFGAALEYGANRIVPGYKTIEERRMHLFGSDEKLLAGEIVEIKDDTVIVLNDFDGKEWEVEIEQLPPFELQEGMRVGMIGERTSNDTFRAEHVRPWDGGPGRGGPLGRRVPGMGKPGPR